MSRTAPPQDVTLLPAGRVLHLRSRAVRLLLLSALAGRAEAQVLYGSIVGRVSDASQAAVPGATVTIVHQETNLAREATTSGDGAYRFVNVLPGTYTVRVAVAGFKEHVEKDVPVSVNTVARVDLRLEVGTLSEAITVESGQTLLQTDTGDLHAELKSGEITALPLGNYRNYQTLLNLVPGTTPAQFQNAPIDTPARALSTNVNGTARNNNNTRLDGTTNVYVCLPHHAVYVAPAETVSTVNVSTASFDAEQGMAGGAAVTVLTKSGTNELHGSAIALHENEDLRARNFFNPGEKIDSSRNIVGATLGGPIVKDRLFFFASVGGRLRDALADAHGDRRDRGHAERRLQRLRHDDLRPGHRQPRRERPHAVPRQRHSARPHRARSPPRSRRPSRCRTGTAASATTRPRGPWRWTATTSTSSSTTTSAPPPRSGRSTAR